MILQDAFIIFILLCKIKTAYIFPQDMIDGPLKYFYWPGHYFNRLIYDNLVHHVPVIWTLMFLVFIYTTNVFCMLSAFF